MKVIPVVLAGGSGTRLWPLSKPGTPKQFLKVFGGKTLLQNTIERTLGLNPECIVIVTGESLRLETSAQVKELGLRVVSPEEVISGIGSPYGGRQGENPHPNLPPKGEGVSVVILAEPLARNTAPAVALSAAFVRDAFGPDAVAAVLPADHHIGNTDAFTATLRTAIDAAAAEDVLVTLGIHPDRPETGYGYIHADGASGEAVVVKRFVEKPDVATATRYLAEGGYYWNSGIFIWRAGNVLSAIAAHMPELATLAEKPWGHLYSNFAAAPSISVDYGLMERAQNVRMVAAGFPWSDVGTWDSVAPFWKEEGRLAEPVAQVQSDSVDVFSNRPVAVVGVEDIMVVDTDEGLLIMKKGLGQEIGAVAKTVAALPAAAPLTGAVPRVVPKPWGQELIWAETDRYVGKTLTVKAGESLSLQYHRLKDETIHVLSGKLKFFHGPDEQHLTETVMSPGESFHIKTMTVHRMEAIEDTDVLEVSTPQLDDVVRLIDRYGR